MQNNNIQIQALARKWRPQTFAQTAGQDIVVKALSNALDTNRLHHAYLFTGTRGVGKTTLSRLLAKALSCDKGISSTPCGICNNCISIQNAQYIDYIELDAASNRGVEEISKLLENAGYQPSQGRFKIFMIDEVHMLSNHAFNAMLKTLEEPPEHVKFILATTDAHKIPMTVLSRCLQFHLRPVPSNIIINYLKQILQNENILFEENALNYIAKAAYGSMRDALSITDQAIALGHGNVTADETKQMLGLLDDDLPIKLLINLANNNMPDCLSLLENIQNADKFLDNLIVHLQNIAIIQCLETAIIDTNYLNEIKQLAKLINAENIQIYYQMAIKTKQELNFCPPEIALNMLCIRMMHFNMPLDKNKAINIINNDISNVKNNATAINIDKSSNVKPIVSSISNIPNSNINQNNRDKDEFEHKINLIQNENENKSEKIEVKAKVHNISNTPDLENKSKPELANIDNNLNSINLANSTSQEVISTDNGALNLELNNLPQINNKDWLDIIPQLNLDGLALQIAKQSILKQDNGKSIILNCEFDTSVMKNAVSKLETIIGEFLNRKINLSIISNNQNIHNISSQVSKSDAEKLDEEINHKTLFKQEQDEKANYQKQQIEKAYQDKWVMEFINLGAKIIIN